MTANASEEFFVSPDSSSVDPDQWSCSKFEAVTVNVTFGIMIHYNLISREVSVLMQIFII